MAGVIVDKGELERITALIDELENRRDELTMVWENGFTLWLTRNAPAGGPHRRDPRRCMACNVSFSYFDEREDTGVVRAYFGSRCSWCGDLGPSIENSLPVPMLEVYINQLS